MIPVWDYRYEADLRAAAAELITTPGCQEDHSQERPGVAGSAAGQLTTARRSGTN